jgi:hypothetical protein
MKVPRLAILAAVVALVFASIASIGLAAPAAEDQIFQTPEGELYIDRNGLRYRVSPLPLTPDGLQSTTESTKLAPGSVNVPGGAALGPRVVKPSAAMGLSRERPIPLGWTCSCSTDRSGQVSSFDISISRVEPDALGLVQAANRFNRPPRPGALYIAAYVEMKYLGGPQDQAYTISEADFHATTSDANERDSAAIIFESVENRVRGDYYPGSYAHGWLIFELSVGRPAFLVWNNSFVGERGVWFALE